MNTFLRHASVNIELKKENRVYLLSIPVGSSYVEVEEVIKELSDHIAEMKAASEKKEKEEAEKKASEESKENSEDKKDEEVKEDK